MKNKKEIFDKWTVPKSLKLYVLTEGNGEEKYINAKTRHHKFLKFNEVQKKNLQVREGSNGQ